MMSERGDRLLREAGWTAERAVDISADLKALSSIGVEPWPALLTFLRSYSGLRVLVDDELLDRDFVELGSQFGIPDVNAKDLAGYEPRVGTRLAPIGIGQRYYLVVMLGENGRFYTSFGDLLWQEGDSPSEMIDTVLSLGREVQIP